MALGGASNPGPQSNTGRINTSVLFDRTTGNLFGNSVHLGSIQFGAATTLIVGASPYAYTNTYTGSVLNTALTYTPAQLQQVFISGGTVSALTITRNGIVTAIPVTTPMVLLAVNDVLTVTYSVAPAMTVFQMY